MLKALYGGTFDPIHYGHLKIIEALSNLIKLKLVNIMPNNVPPHRPQPESSSQHRKEMLEIAISNKPLFYLDKRELNRNVPSYISYTLREWRKEWNPKQPLAFVIGQDSLLNVPFWYQYETILNNVHLIVCQRPGYQLLMKDKYHQKWLEQHLTENVNDLYTQPANKIYLAKTPLFNISASVIRNRLRRKKSCEELVPPLVLNFIFQHSLYQKKDS